MEKIKTNYSALTVLVTVFFFWGFIAAGNSIFIPFCKEYFHLDQFQSLLIDFAFYFAYYIGALFLFIVSTFKGVDPVGKWGYKNSIVYGLVFSALGAAAMIFSVYNDVFVGMLFGLFIVALGFSLQQTAANPFMIALGDESTGSNRISLGGGINSLGTTIAPLVVGLVLFGSVKVTDEMKTNLSLEKVIYLYAFVGLLFLAIAALFAFSRKLPSGKLGENLHPEQANNCVIDTSSEKQSPAPVSIERANKALGSLAIITGLLIICFVPVFGSYLSDEAKQISLVETQLGQVQNVTANVKTIAILQSEISALKKPLEQERLLWLSAGLVVVVGGIFASYRLAQRKQDGWGAMRYPQLILGMLAIFIYVGVEVTIGSNLGELLNQKEFQEFSNGQIAPYIALFWGSLMIGRWASAIHVFSLSEKGKTILTVVVPLVAFALVLTFSVIAGHAVDHLYAYVICVLVLIGGFLLGRNKPAKTLLIFSLLGVAATLVGIFGTGMIAIYGFMSAGLFCSIMWPCIFSLSLAGLGKYKAQGSAFLIMMILGGAIIPPLQGKLMDLTGVQPSFFVGTICFLYLAFFAAFVSRSLGKQGISLDA